jgi:hypothetical protein
LSILEIKSFSDLLFLKSEKCEMARVSTTYRTFVPFVHWSRFLPQQNFTSLNLDLLYKIKSGVVQCSFLVFIDNTLQLKCAQLFVDNRHLSLTINPQL